MLFKKITNLSASFDSINTVHFHTEYISTVTTENIFAFKYMVKIRDIRVAWWLVRELRSEVIRRSRVQFPPPA